MVMSKETYCFMEVSQPSHPYQGTFTQIYGPFGQPDQGPLRPFLGVAQTLLRLGCLNLQGLHIHTWRLAGRKCSVLHGF